VDALAVTDSAVEKSRQTAGGGAYRPGVDLLVLGPVEVRNHGEPVPIGGPKQRAILALLAAEVGHPVSLDRMVDDVYGEDATEGARRSARTFISMIRRELGDIVQNQGSGYVLMVEPSTIDAFRFEDQVRAAIPLVESDPEMASASLREALALWRGHPYADVDSCSLLQPETIRLTDLRLAALEARIDADLALGRHRELTGELEALIVEHPLREKLRAQHMLALYRSGRQTEALRSFERARLYLADEIGIAPSPDLCGLEQRILEQDPTLDLPAAASVTQRAVLVVDAAGPEDLSWVRPDGRDALTESLVRIHNMVAAHNADTVTQRGSAIYASFLTIEDAVATVEDIIPAATNGASPRASIDFGDIELHESGDVGGPPVRRSAGIIAISHPGQVLLSSEANQALMAGGRGGRTVRSLGTHRIHGVESPQQIFQLVMAGQDGDFPALLLDAYPPPLPFDRTAVPGYELRQPIASDLVGTTYRAYQPSAGREVELTVIDPAWAAERDFVSRFEVETQLVSRLQHPHVVPLLDYWRDPSGAYLVSLSVRGGTLAERLATGGLAIEAVPQLVTQIGEALAYAHGMGIPHGAVSPRTVLIDKAHNAYLPASGFVMHLVGVPQSQSTYTAPEQAEGETPGPVADVYGLGRIAETLLGEPTAVETAVVGDLRRVIERATAQRDADRFPSMGDFLAAWNEGSGREQTRSGPSPLRNPYKGLSAFEEVDAGDFFGRSASVAELVEMLAERKLVAVVGPSGSGKSSLVHAGLVPAVRDGVLGEPGQWLVADMFPGSYPLEELESALSRVAVENPGALVDELGSDDRGLTRVIKRILPAGTRLLLVIDQFEELFTLTREQEARDRLLRGLVDLVADERSETRVVLTLRADFFDRPLQHPDFGELIKAGTYAVTAPGTDELLEAIELPGREAGAIWENGLPEAIIDDVARSPGMLPLLQYALTELFADRQGNDLTYAAYRANGGVMGALSSRADEVYDGLDDPARELSRQVFLRLVTVQPSGEVTRRRVRLPELNSLGDPEAVKRVLDVFGDARLLVFDRDPISRSPTVEVAHEALLIRWPLLAGWIDEAGEDLLLHRRLQDALEEWETRDREEEYLLSGGRLAQFETWAGSTDLTLGPSEAEYLQVSGVVAARQRSRRRRIRNTVTAGFGVAALVAGLFAVSAARNADVAHSRELGASAVNVLDEDPELSVLLALQAAQIADPPLQSVSALHESLASHNKIFSYQWPVEREAVELMTAISPDGRLLAARADGSYIEVVEVDSGRKAWDREFPEGAIVQFAFAPDGSNLLVTVGRESEEGSESLEAELGVHGFDAKTGDLIHRLPVPGCGVVSESIGIKVVGPGEGTHLVTEPIGEEGCQYLNDPEDSEFPPISLLDLSTGKSESLWDTQGDVFVSADGTHAIVGEELEDSWTTRLIEVRTGLETAVLPGYPQGISNDASVVITDSDPFGLATWDLEAHQYETPVTTFDESLGVWLSPDGGTVARLVGASVELVDTRTGEVEERLLTGLGSNDGLTFSADGSRVAVDEGFGGAAVVFDLSQAAEVDTIRLCDKISLQTGQVEVRGSTASVFADCVSGSDGDPIQFLLQPETLEIRAALGDQSGIRSALSPDGRMVATQKGRSDTWQGDAVTLGEDFTVLPGDEVWLIGPIVVQDTSTGGVVQTLDGLCEWVENGTGTWPECAVFPETPFPDWPWDLVFSEDGSLLAMGGQNTPAVVVWDVRSGEIIGAPLAPGNHHEWAFTAAFSPDGERIAASFGPGPKDLSMFSTVDWQPMHQYVAPAEADSTEPPVDNLLFTPDGEILIGSDFTNFGEGRIVFMDGVTLEHLAEIPDAHDAGVFDLALSQDGTRLASAGGDGVVRVWDVETRALLHEIPLPQVGNAAGFDSGAAGVDFVGDESHLLVAGLHTGELQRVTTDTEELLEIAQSRVTRGFTDTECTTYRIDPCPTLEEIREG
jgi:DNA-binding SARP family transcriptional activator/WD40 repeat protein